MTTKSQCLHSLCLLLMMSGLSAAVNGQEAPPDRQGPTTSSQHPSVVMVLGYNKKTGAHQQATGFFLNQAGDVVTNYHVIAGIRDIKIWTTANQGFPVTKIINTDLPADLAILAVDIPSNSVQPASIAGQMPVADETIQVIGHPLGHQQRRSQGLISSLFPTAKVGPLLQFTAPIAAGSSGSPLLNDSGQVVGIASFILYLDTDKEPRYFAIPSTRLILLQKTSGPDLYSSRHTEDLVKTPRLRETIPSGQAPETPADK